MPGTKHSINLSFEPKNLGSFTQLMELTLLKGAYKIPLKLLGQCTSIGEKKKAIRGPKATDEDFEPERNFITEEEAEIAPNKRKTRRGDGVPKFLQDSTSMQIDETL